MILDYDTNVFETVTQSNVTVKGSWASAVYTEATKKIIAYKNSYASASEQILEIKLKVKSNISVETSTVSLKNITSSNGEDDFTTSAATKTFSITDTNPNNDNQNPNNDNQNPNNDNQNPNNNSNNNSQNNKSTNNSQATSNLPKAGVKEIILPLIVIVSVVSILVYIKYKSI